MKEIDIDQMLNPLGSDEARNIAIYKLIGKVEIPPFLIKNAIDFFERKEDYIAAAHLALKANMKERAIDIYEKGVNLFLLLM